jgi:hypothetical protein
MGESIYRDKKVILFSFWMLQSTVRSSIAFASLIGQEMTENSYVSERPQLLPPFMKEKDMKGLGNQYPLQGKPYLTACF